MFRYKPTLRSRIYISMLALILISLVVIGVTTIAYFNKQNKEYHVERLKRKEKTVVLSLGYFFKDAQTEAQINTISRDFEEEVIKLADINNVEINVYSVEGEILTSSSYDYSNPDYYKKKIPEEILLNLLKTKSRQVETLEDNNISTYSYLFSENENRPIAIINIPYHLTDEPDNRGLTPFLTKLIQVYLFLLFGASLIAFFLSNYITKSLRAITEKLKQVKINKKNEPIKWPGQDEIGTLVAEYNDMILQLENSAKKLAKSERESAWREMAKQVAHEIKNPLTPMKLSVQHLQRSLNSSDTDHTEKLTQFSEKMIRQIDTLTSIANEFSNFAKMPKANMKEIDIKSILHASIYVFEKEKNMSLDYQEDNDEGILLIGDDEQLTRVFNNLIKNAIQSIPNDTNGKISVRVNKTISQCVISIEDNGTGIPDELRDKIFTPNFTTKSSGSGLGLAMVSQIIRAHNGSVDFKTQLDKGSTFLVYLPLP